MAKNTSFLPEDYLERRVARRTNMICISLFVVVMAGLVGAFFMKAHESRLMRAQQQNVDHRFAEAAKRLDQLQKLQQKKQQMIEKAKVTSALVEKIPRSTLLAELINNMPTRLSLLTLNLTTKTVRPRRPRTAIERAKRREKKKMDAFKVRVPKTIMTISLVGVAPTDVDVSQYMTNLSKQPLFNNVSLSYSEQATIQGRTMRKFGIQMGVNENVNLRKVKLLKVARKLKQNPMSRKIQITGSGVQAPATSNVTSVSDSNP